MARLAQVSAHKQVETPGWDTKLLCDCGFQAATKRELAVHLEEAEREAGDGHDDPIPSW